MTTPFNLPVSGINLNFKLTPDPEKIGGYPETVFTFSGRVSCVNQEIFNTLIINNFVIEYYLNQTSKPYGTQVFLISGQTPISALNTNEFTSLNTFTNLVGEISGNMQLFSRTSPSYWIVQIDNSLYFETSGYIYGDNKINDNTYEKYDPDKYKLTINYQDGWNINYQLLNTHELTSYLQNTNTDILTFSDSIQIHANIIDESIKQETIYKSDQYLREYQPGLSAVLINKTTNDIIDSFNTLNIKQNETLKLSGKGVKNTTELQDHYLVQTKLKF